MSDAAAVVMTPVSAADKRLQVEVFLGGIFEHMDYPARLEFKDMPDGGLGVAVFFENAEHPGIAGSKRTYLVDCIQFLTNKVVNRPNVEKRWVTLGVNGFPEPRGAKPEPSAPTAPKASAPKALAPPPASKAPAPARASAPPVAAANAKRPPPQQQPARPARSNDHDERSMKVEPTPMMTRLGQTLAQKAGTFGRFYAVPLLTTDDRARVMAAASAAKGVTVKAEGEGYFRRVVFTPEKPTVIAKKQVMPDYDDEE